MIDILYFGVSMFGVLFSCKYHAIQSYPIPVSCAALFSFERWLSIPLCIPIILKNCLNPPRLRVSRYRWRLNALLVAAISHKLALPIPNSLESLSRIASNQSVFSYSPVGRAVLHASLVLSQPGTLSISSALLLCALPPSVHTN